ncbi:MAG: GIY-YIG nuclease family protein [Candidatus Acidiferrales bacterium]
MFTVYILQSAKTGQFYIGHTSDLTSRIERHNLGLTKSGRNRGTWKLVYQEVFSTRAEAVRRERQIKKWKSHKYIEEFIKKARTD